MISTHLQGGLGNYMFQIAAAEALAIDLGTKSVFDFNLASQVHKNIRSYQDNIFNEINDISGVRFQSKYSEQGFGYQDLPKTTSLYLIGYFQSEKYFKNHCTHIKSVFSATPETQDMVYRKYSDIFYGVVCSIHVRRGDYLKLQDHHPVLGMQYYNEAIDKVVADKYLIFSDDIEWCKQNFIGDQFIFIEGEPDYVDMFLMSLCDHNIIANSSFSWWGAWLNSDDDKIVVAPENWFGPAKGDINTSDLIPEKWIKIV